MSQCAQHRAKNNPWVHPRLAFGRRKKNPTSKQAIVKGETDGHLKRWIALRKKGKQLRVALSGPAPGPATGFVRSTRRGVCCASVRRGRHASCSCSCSCLRCCRACVLRCVGRGRPCSWAEFRGSSKSTGGSPRVELYGACASPCVCVCWRASRGLKISETLFWGGSNHPERTTYDGERKDDRDRSSGVPVEWIWRILSSSPKYTLWLNENEHVSQCHRAKGHQSEQHPASWNCSTCSCAYLGGPPSSSGSGMMSVSWRMGNGQRQEAKKTRH